MSTALSMCQPPTATLTCTSNTAGVWKWLWMRRSTPWRAAQPARTSPHISSLVLTTSECHPGMGIPSSCEHSLTMVGYPSTSIICSAQAPESAGRKRKAADDLQSPSARRPCRVGSDAPLPSSIGSVLQHNCRERLYVPPIAWASRQPELLGCEFAQQKEQQKGDPPGQNPSLWGQLRHNHLRPCGVPWRSSGGEEGLFKTSLTHMISILYGN